MDSSFLTQYEFGNALGEGAYGEVRLAMSTRSQEACACKIISLNLLADKSLIQKEVLVHKALNHENIIKFFSSHAYDDKFYIFMEYASGGELFDRIEPDVGMHADIAHKYFHQLINGIEFIHSKGIVHRDIKPENLLFNEHDVLKIADFGLATLFQYKGNERLLSSPCGTAPYVAMEVLSRREYRAQPTDIWSCGIVLVAMLAGELPWDKPVLDNADFNNWVHNNFYQQSPWCKLETSALGLIKKMLFIDAEKRFTIREIKSSAWCMRTSLYKTMNELNQRKCMSDNIYMSQPTTGIYTHMSSNGSSNNSIEMQVSDAAACGDFSHDVSMVSHAGSEMAHIQSFSQPISTDSMWLNSQIQNTQNFSQIADGSSAFFRLVKRMTRLLVHTNVDETVEELKKLFQKYIYEYKITTLTSLRQRQITVSTMDKRQNPLTFKINLIEMAPSVGKDVLVDFRLSKGDGLEFKKLFMKFKNDLMHVICKRYFYPNATCCEK